VGHPCWLDRPQRDRVDEPLGSVSVHSVEPGAVVSGGLCRAVHYDQSEPPGPARPTPSGRGFSDECGGGTADRGATATACNDRNRQARPDHSDFGTAPASCNKGVSRSAKRLIQANTRTTSVVGGSSLNQRKSEISRQRL